MRTTLLPHEEPINIPAVGSGFWGNTGSICPFPILRLLLDLTVTQRTHLYRLEAFEPSLARLLIAVLYVLRRVPNRFAPARQFS